MKSQKKEYNAWKMRTNKTSSWIIMNNEWDTTDAMSRPSAAFSFCHLRMLTSCRVVFTLSGVVPYFSASITVKHRELNHRLGQDRPTHYGWILAWVRNRNILMHNANMSPEITSRMICKNFFSTARKKTERDQWLDVHPWKQKRRWNLIWKEFKETLSSHKTEVTSNKNPSDEKNGFPFRRCDNMQHTA